MEYFAPDTVGGFAYFAPDAPPVTTSSVSSGLAASYVVRGATLADLASSYAIRGPVSASLAATYALRGAVSTNLAAAYTVSSAISSVSADLAGSYSIAALVLYSVSASLAGAYSLRGGASASLSGSYQVFAGFEPAKCRTYVVPSDEAASTAPKFKKAAAAILDYSFDWSPYLAGTEDTITQYEIVSPAQLVKSKDKRSDGVVTFWLSGGIAGYAHEVECKITTAQGRTDVRTISVEVVAHR